MRTLVWGGINPHSVPPGQPYRFGDPNLRWGSPSYALEPGDPGFVPYTLSSSPTSKTKTKMKRQNYYPTRQADQAVWLENFRLKLALYAAALGIAPARLADIVADSRWLVSG